MKDHPNGVHLTDLGANSLTIELEPIHFDRNRRRASTCRLEALDAIRAMVNAGRTQFTVRDVCTEMQARGTKYSVESIKLTVGKTMTGRLGIPYVDLVQVRRGVYRLNEAPDQLLHNGAAMTRPERVVLPSCRSYLLDAVRSLVGRSLTREIHLGDVWAEMQALGADYPRPNMYVTLGDIMREPDPPLIRVRRGVYRQTRPV